MILHLYSCVIVKKEEKKASDDHNKIYYDHQMLRVSDTFPGTIALVESMGLHWPFAIVAVFEDCKYSLRKNGDDREWPVQTHTFDTLNGLL